MVKKRALICPQSTSDAPLIHEFDFASVALATITNSGHGPNNEDAVAAFSIDKQAGLVAVADGAGGLPAGAAASLQSIEVINRATKSSKIKAAKSIRETVIESIFSANKKVLSKKNGSGSTLASVLLDKNKVQAIYVGDSIIIIAGQKGRIKYINFPHSPIGYLYRAGIGVNDPKQLAQFSHIVSNLLGTQEMFIEIGPTVPLNKNDTVLVCSDGLSDIMITKDIVELIRSGTLEQAATNLLDKIKHLIQSKYIEHDDITFCLARRNH